MKQFITILVSIACLCGCEKIFIPSSVTLSADGETITVETTIQPMTMDIRDRDGNGIGIPEHDEATGTYTLTWEWLSASISESSYENGTYKLVLTAQKNTTGAIRTLYVGGMDKNYQDCMKVTQSK